MPENPHFELKNRIGMLNSIALYTNMNEKLLALLPN